ncbi:MAG: eukaryotic translation initiation factor 5B, partial [Paramarteilia canceri]
SLESLLVFLRESKIAYSSVNIGDVFKKDVLKTETMVELSPMHAVILAFDVKVDKEAQEIARQVGVKIFQANIIYHLQEKFAQYVLDFRETQKKARWDDAIFPCVLHILPECIFNMKDPLVCGVGIDEGEIRTNSILRVITDKDSFVIGKVISIEKDKKSIERAVAGENVAVKIAALPGSSESSHRYYGRHFDHKSEIVSDISRKTIDVLKEFYRSEMTTDYWRLVVNLKSKLKIA